MFFPPEAFIAVMDCLAQLPFSVLGGVVNKRAVHTKHHATLHPGDHLLHRYSQSLPLVMYPQRYLISLKYENGANTPA